MERNFGRQEERLVNLVNDHKYAKIYPTNFSNVAEAIVIILNSNGCEFPFYNANFEVAISSGVANLQAG